MLLSSLSFDLSGVRDGLSETLVFPLSDVIISSNRTNSSISYQLVGINTLDYYLDLLKNAKYANSFNEPTPGIRILSIQAFNKESDMPPMSSNTPYTIIEVVNLNDNFPLFSLNKYIGIVRHYIPCIYLDIVRKYSLLFSLLLHIQSLCDHVFRLHVPLDPENAYRGYQNHACLLNVQI